MKNLFLHLLVSISVGLWLAVSCFHSYIKDVKAQQSLDRLLLLSMLENFANILAVSHTQYNVYTYIRD